MKARSALMRGEEGKSREKTGDGDDRGIRCGGVCQTSQAACYVPQQTSAVSPQSPSKHEAFTQWWVNVGPTSETAGQH